MSGEEWMIGIGGFLFVCGMLAIYLLEYREKKQRKARTHNEWKNGSKRKIN